MCKFPNCTFLHFKKSYCTFSKCAIAKPWFWLFWLLISNTLWQLYTGRWRLYPIMIQKTLLRVILCVQKLINKFLKQYPFQGWAIAHFENVRLLHLKYKKVQFGKSCFFGHFLSFAFFQTVIVRSLFLKCEKCAILKFALFLHICSFQKSNCAITLFCTIENCNKKCDHTITL